MSRIRNVDWRPEAGTVTLIGEDGAQVEMPMLALKPLADHAARFLAAKASPVGDSGYLSVSAMTVQTVDVRPIQTTDGEKVALLMDHRQTTEFAVQIEPQLALQLSEELRSVAERATTSPPRKQ